MKTEGRKIIELDCVGCAWCGKSTYFADKMISWCNKNNDYVDAMGCCKDWEKKK